MPNNFSANILFELESLDSSLSNLSPLASLTVITNESVSAQLSPNVLLDVISVPADTLSPPFQDVISFIGSNFISFTTTIEGDFLMPNIIHMADQAEINVSNLIITDKTGASGCVIVSPNGTSYQLNGVRVGFENQTVSYIIPQNKSGYVWTNTGAGAITAQLPSGASIGTTALLIRTGGAVSITPTSTGRIWLSASGYFRPAGTTITLASSGAKIGLISDGNQGWYPTIEEGSIT